MVFIINQFFSTLKTLKNFLRLNVGQERLNALFSLNCSLQFWRTTLPVLSLLNSFFLIIKAKFIMDILFETMSN